jgi:hypothetical protein
MLCPCLTESENGLWFLFEVEHQAGLVLALVIHSMDYLRRSSNVSDASCICADSMLQITGRCMHGCTIEVALAPRTDGVGPSELQHIARL